MRLVIIVVGAIAGCARAPSPAEISLDRNRQECHAACDAQHKACLENPPGLCTNPCSDAYLQCHSSCPPAPPRYSSSSIRPFEQQQP